MSPSPLRLKVDRFCAKVSPIRHSQSDTPASHAIFDLNHFNHLHCYPSKVAIICATTSLRTSNSW